MSSIAWVGHRAARDPLSSTHPPDRQGSRSQWLSLLYGCSDCRFYMVAV